MIIVGPVAKRFYHYLVDKKKMPVNKAVYYNRKLIHIAAGGFVALLVPFLFKTPILPFILAMILALLTYLPHKKGELMYWFQVPDNMYEVHFCVMWGIIITLSWIIFGNYWYGVIPVSFMAFGDAATGIVRNALYGHRTKSWYGNLAMLGVTLPIGALVGIPGIIAALIASFIEHFEFKGIDDNITVPLTGFLTIYILQNTPILDQLVQVVSALS
ncbi:dolichol kinase [Desulfurococcaceae archaeon MEX13E-LK6-19]|nr:dolichol kinase [Desulfurococcaceae archaeon MEX13E-LK6-19]